MYKYGLNKKADVSDDSKAKLIGLIATLGGGVVPNTLGLLQGVLTLSKEPKLKIRNLNLSSTRGGSYIPYLGGLRQGLRRAAVSLLAGSKSNKSAVSLLFGGLTSAALLATIGGLISAASDRDWKEGALAGLGTHVGINLLSKFLANKTLDRSLKEQKEYLNSTGRTIANYLVPGQAGYNSLKSLLLSGLNHVPTWQRVDIVK